MGPVSCAEVEEDSQSRVYTLRSRTVRQLDNWQSSKCSPKTANFNPSAGWETEKLSQESVSMLDDRYRINEFPELMETCSNSEPEEVDIYSDEEMEESADVCPAGRVENATQTDIISFGDDQENEIIKHAKFISAVVRLKTALSSRKTISDSSLRGIIHVSGDELEEAMEVDYPKETVDYLLRSSDVGNIFSETVRVLLQHLERTLEDFSKFACCWKNSVYEMAVEILIRAVDCETGVWKMVDQFLCRTIASVLSNEDQSENLILESKTNFIISFCHSTHLSCTVVSSAIEKLKTLKSIGRRNERTSMADRFSWTRLTKNSYYLLRMVESSLRLLKSKVEGGKIENVVKQPEGKYYNVLEMWKKHWNGGEVSGEKKTTHEWELTVSEWCRQLDEISLHCVRHVPVLSTAAERCGVAAKDVLKTCHP